MVIDGNNWEANTSTTVNFSTNGTLYYDPNVIFNPPLDSAHATMLRTFRDNGDLQCNLASVPNGNYDVYVWTFEDNQSLNATLSINGSVVLPSYDTGATGHWDRLGPYSTTVSNGTVQIELRCNTPGDTNFLSGIEVWLKPPTAPTNLTASLSSNRVNLAWTDRSTNETGFQVERSTNGTTFAVLTTTAANVTSYTDSSVTIGQRYYYRVCAKNTAGLSSYTNVVNITP